MRKSYGFEHNEIKKRIAGEGKSEGKIIVFNSKTELRNWVEAGNYIDPTKSNFREKILKKDIKINEEGEMEYRF